MTYTIKFQTGRWKAFCCTILCSLACLTVCAQDSTTPYEKRSFNPSTLSTLIDAQAWTKVRSYVQKAAQQKQLRLKDLEHIAHTHPHTPFSHAVAATKNMLTMKKQLEMPLSICFPIALYAETDLQKAVAKGKVYWTAKQFGRALEVDPESHRLFIHLKKNSKNIIGKGAQKLVIKTVLYDRNFPEVMAYGFTKSNIEREVDVMKGLRGLPHVMNLEGALKHKNSSSTIHGLVTKIYNAGSLQDIISKKSYHLTIKEKISIAHQLITGLNAMHSRHYVHRDLGAKNYFINILGKKPDHRLITGCVADMGRATHIKRLPKMAVQGNSWYMPPEGFFPNKMKPKDYYLSDLFSFGCAMWNLYFGKLPEWSYKRYFKDEHRSMKERQKLHIAHIRRERAKKSKHLYERGSNKSRHKQFLRLIIKMTHPCPQKRGTTASIKKALAKLIDWPPVCRTKGTLTTTKERLDSTEPTTY